MRKRILLASCLCVLAVTSCTIPDNKGQIWNIGVPDSSTVELALGPDRYKDFLANDFGFEDRYFLVGKSDVKKSFPYVLPGPADQWGGTWSTAGLRTHDVNILFGLENIPEEGEWSLIVDLADNSPHKPPLLKVLINNSQEEKIQLTSGGSDASITGDMSQAKPIHLSIPVKKGILREGGNSITLSVLEGSWLLFDHVGLQGPSRVRLVNPEKAFVRSVKAADYEVATDSGNKQPLLVDVEHLEGQPALAVELDGKEIFSTVLDTARYCLEVPMPAVASSQISTFEVRADGKLLQKGKVERKPQPLQTFARYVDTRIGTAHSRWMIAPGPWMPFGMVKLSPDNQNAGWQAGYQPTFESVGCFSHIHEWTMGGLGMMPTNGPLQTIVGDETDPDSGYRSRIDKLTEEAPLGYYKVDLTDYGIRAELTATTHCGFQRYTFPSDKDSARVLVDLHIPAEYDYQLEDVEIKKVSDTRIEGYSHQLSKYVWSSDADQEYTLHFVIEFDQPIESMGGWINKKREKTEHLTAQNIKNAGVWLQFDTKKSPVVQARSGISLVSIANAAENLEKEISSPFGWQFDQVRNNQVNVWNDLFDRVLISTNDRLEKVRFYTNMYRALCSRNIWSDVNGEWVSADEKVRRFSDPDDVALGCDAFWNTFWNLNQFWNLVTPEWSNRWVKSQLAMYDANGWLAKGPAGMEYIPVMVAEHEIPLIVSAWQMGIRGFDGEKAFAAVKKMQTTPSQKVCGGYAGNRDLMPYLKHRYVPADLGRFSNTLEYAYDDWTVSQLAEALGKEEDAKLFAERGSWWKNAINPETGYAQMRNSDGSWSKDFDPFHSGANHHYVEGNAWQLTYFVPQNVPALAEMIGKDRFVERLQWGFGASEPWRYNAPNDQYWDYPVVQGNQQSMHFAFLFNWVGQPWLTQKWSRSIIERYYGGGMANAYLGDEDQGQMSAWFVMAALGLFQTDGGCSIEPVYEIASPLYEKVVIDLGERFGRGQTFTIEAHNASRVNKYVQSAVLNGKQLQSFRFPASELLKGGTLTLEMGPTPDYSWGIER
ncbi:GH92 family glycosyl hydrolase [Parabacteroides goldsteinii]|uniref:GH92 family glycosyl hydrolase n=1 Tax=Parabacteroides goldsteinii TaxID=328812 RepID=UPI00101DCBEF|nr:GH92 family glycosyl hydrolase [Parabacteroides goldsteinii]